MDKDKKKFNVMDVSTWSLDDCKDMLSKDLSDSLREEIKLRKKELS